MTAMTWKTTPTPTLAQRLAHRARPKGRAAMRHRWHNLCFLHWEIPVETSQALLPEGLFADCFDGKAHVGIVAFGLSGIRPWWSPAIPHLSEFLELNVRLYCHDGAGHAGIYFLSLDCDRAAAVWGARCVWGLPYTHAHIASMNQADATHFRCRRRGEAQAATFAWRPTAPAAVPAPGTLEHFLVDRYRLFVRDKRGVVRHGDVFHPPYEVAPVALDAWSGEPLGWDGLPVPEDAPMSALVCPGVDVEVFALKRLEKP